MSQVKSRIFLIASDASYNFHIKNTYLKFHTKNSAGTKCEKIFNDVIVPYFTNDLETALTNFLGNEGTMILTLLQETVGLGLDDLVGLQQTVVNGLDAKLLCHAAAP